MHHTNILDVRPVKRIQCAVYDISDTLSKNPVMKYFEDGPVEDGPVEGGSKLHTAISELDYLPHERKSSSCKGEGFTLTIMADGGVGLKASVRALFSKRSVEEKPEFEQSSQDEEEEVIERELSTPFSLTVRGQASETDICKEVMTAVLDLRQLVELNLSKCVLPDYLLFGLEFGEAYSLETLNLDWLKLRRIHPSIGRLRNLKDLSICYNRLSDLPLTIRLLKNLRCLAITGNPFTRIPGSIYHLLGLETIKGFNDCPLSKCLQNGWHKVSKDICWRKPMAFPPKRDSVDTLKESCVQASVGMDCWLLSLPKRLCETLSKLAETQGLCENCMKPVRKLTAEHESQGYTIHAQVGLFCGVRDVPFTFMACSDTCLDRTVRYVTETNRKYSMKGISKLPSCNYELEFVQDLAVLQEQRAINLAAVTARRAQGNRHPRRSSVDETSLKSCTVL